MADLPFLDIERRTGIKNADIDDFLSKVTAVDEAIKGLKVCAVGLYNYRQTQRKRAIASQSLFSACTSSLII